MSASARSLALPPVVSAEQLLNDAAARGRAAGTQGSSAQPAVVFADVRWYLDGRSGYDAYLGGHIEGAVFVSLDEHLAAPPTSAEGRHPLPTPEAFAASMGALGIDVDDTVVAYDDTGGMSAGRLVWMLRTLGCDAALLDGGIAAWPEPLVGEPTVRSPVARVPQVWPAEVLATADETEAQPHSVADGAAGVVIDARAANRYAGEEEPVDPRAGHIPGALNVPWNSNLGDDGKFLAPEQLRTIYDGAGGEAVPGQSAQPVVYCGSGVSACVNLLAIEFAYGEPAARLYPGSWSQWSADEQRPAALGPTSWGERSA